MPAAPGTSTAAPSWRRPWPWGLAALWAAAAVARLALLDGPLHAEEAVHYAVARGWGSDPANVHPEYGLNGALWWRRPLFSLLLAPGAALGAAAYRTEHALLAAALAPLAASVARAAGARAPWALAAGAAAALHPTLAGWGAHAFPDSLMAVLALAGVRAHLAGRPALAGAWLLAAAWTKETALLGVAGLLAWSLWRGRRTGAVDLWPLRLDRPATGLAFALALGALPLAYASLRLGGAPPGGGAASAIVLPAAAALVAAAILLSAGTRHASAALRASSRAAAGVAAALLVAVAVLPANAGARPGEADAGEPPAHALRPDQWDAVFLVDVPWYFVDHPFAQRAGAVGWSYTGVDIPLAEWSHAVEGTDATVLAKVDRPLNLALRRAYADCVQHDEEAYLVIEGPRCPGRSDALRRALEDGAAS